MSRPWSAHLGVSVIGRASLARGGNSVKAGDPSRGWSQRLRCGCYEHAQPFGRVNAMKSESFSPKTEMLPVRPIALRRVGHRSCELPSGGVLVKVGILSPAVAAALASRPPRDRMVTTGTLRSTWRIRSVGSPAGHPTRSVRQYYSLCLFALASRSPKKGRPSRSSFTLRGG